MILPAVTPVLRLSMHKGQLVGLAFDGNYEALSHKIAFDKDLNRTICVDVRYVLWCIDKLGSAKNIINELKLVNNNNSRDYRNGHRFNRWPFFYFIPFHGSLTSFQNLFSSIMYKPIVHLKLRFMKTTLLSIFAVLLSAHR